MNTANGSRRRRQLLGLSAGLFAAACASLGTPEDQASATTMWDEIQGHASWAQFPGHAGMQKGKSPHGKFVSTYINAVTASNTASPPSRSVIVKENFRQEDRATLDSLTVMKKVEGYDPENGDWFWARYTPEGELTHSGKVAMCFDCHFDAAGDDFVFLND